MSNEKEYLFLGLLMILGTNICTGQSDYLDENGPYYKALKTYIDQCFVKPTGEILTEAAVLVAAELPMTINGVTFINMQRPDLKEKIKYLKTRQNRDSAPAVSLAPIMTIGDTLRIYIDQMSLSYKKNRLFINKGSALIVDIVYDKNNKTYEVIDTRWQGI